MQTTKMIRELTLDAVLRSFEDADRNRYFPLGDNRYAVRDGGNGADLGIVQLVAHELDELLGQPQTAIRRSYADAG